MVGSTLLTGDAKDYLCCFYQILDDMIQGVGGARLTQSISQNFIAQMIPHHRAAVRLSENVLRYIKDPAVRRIAGQIAAEQAAAIREMEEILPVCVQAASEPRDLRLYQRRTDLICREMYAAMGSAPEGNRLSRVFLEEMIPHCLGAARMARNAMKYPVCVQLVPVLRSAAARQCRLAARMRALLARGGRP